MKDPKAIVPMSLAKRLTQAVSYGLTGGFFSPQMPLQPTEPGTAGRRFDFQAGYNISTKPRRDSGIDFATLRQFAKFYDILRILIEKRKDQISNFEWSIKPTDEAIAAAGGKGAKLQTNGKPQKPQQDVLDELNKRAKAATEFFKFPDGRNSWSAWLRAIVEDMLVLDAITIWPVYEGNKLAKLETVDPATIKIVIDDSGRTPEPPFPAYQQVLHGVPASDYAKDELLYYMSNPATDRIYGLSKVEQILITIQIGLRREMSQLQFFTEGNVPAALAGVPDNWTSTQIETLQKAFDGMMQGDTGSRRKLWFVPGDAAKNIKQLVSEEATLKAEFDEWIIRIMCFAFGLSPQPFIKEMNRATAFTAASEARDEGLGPQLTFLKGMIDAIIKNGLKIEGVEFAWSIDQENDPTAQSNIDDMQLRSGLRSVDELRQRDGLDAIGMTPAIYLPTGPVFVKDLIAEKVGPAQQAGIAQQTADKPPPQMPPGMGGKPGQNPNGGGQGGPQGKGPVGQGGSGAQKPGQKASPGQGPDGKEPANANNRKATPADKPLGKARQPHEHDHSTDIREVSAGSAQPFRKRFNYSTGEIRRRPEGSFQR